MGMRRFGCRDAARWLALALLMGLAGACADTGSDISADEPAPFPSAPSAPTEEPAEVEGDEAADDAENGFVLRAATSEAGLTNRRALSGTQNGRIPDELRCEIPWAAPETILCEALPSLERLNEMFRAEFGVQLEINDSYRSLESQQALRGRARRNAVRPGTSNHGWGLALDLGGEVKNYYTDEYQWMRDHAPALGWINPDYLKPESYQRVMEPWHWEYVVSDFFQPYNGWEES